MIDLRPRESRGGSGIRRPTGPGAAADDDALLAARQRLRQAEGRARELEVSASRG